VQAFRDGKISSGKAAQMLQIPRVDFFDVLADFGVDIYNDVSADTLKQDRANA
jgi:predicted HTH domain antitoxin